MNKHELDELEARLEARDQELMDWWHARWWLQVKTGLAILALFALLAAIMWVVK